MGITKREQRRESLLLYPRLGHVVLPILDPGPKFMVFSSFLDAITSKYPNVVVGALRFILVYIVSQSRAFHLHLATKCLLALSVS